MTQTLTALVGADGVLTLALGEANANKVVRVTVETVEPAAEHSPINQEDREEWLRFIERTAGTIDDPTFIRHPQGEYEQRDEL